MQLRNNLYTVTEKKVDGLTGYFELALTPSCFIYQAHFPSEPITPGVCIVQMGTELLEDLLCEGLQMKKVEMSEDGSEVKAQMVVTSGDEEKAKISLVLSVKC